MGAWEGAGGWGFHKNKPERKEAEPKTKSAEEVLKSAIRKSAPIFAISVATVLISTEELLRTNNPHYSYPLLAGGIASLGSYLFMVAHRLKYGMSKFMDGLSKGRQ